MAPSSAEERAINKLLKDHGIEFARIPLAAEQTKLVTLSLLQRRDLTEVEKSAVLILLMGFALAQQLLKEKN